MFTTHSFLARSDVVRTITSNSDYRTKFDELNFTMNSFILELLKSDLTYKILYYNCIATPQLKYANIFTVYKFESNYLQFTYINGKDTIKENLIP